MVTSKRTLKAIERAERLEQELAEAKRLAREAERDDNRKAREQARRDENRKKILVGAFVITHFNVASIIEKMEELGFLKSDRDRALFGLEPLPAPAPAPRPAPITPPASASAPASAPVPAPAGALNQQREQQAPAGS